MFYLSKSACTLVVAFVIACPVTAQDFYGGGVSARTAAQAGIYVPAPDNVMDALTLNPAGLATITAPVINFTTTGILARGAFTNAINDGSPMRNTAGVVPFGAFGTPIEHSRWSLGLGVTPDLLSSSRWRYSDAPGAAGADYGSQNEKSAILAFRSSVGLAYQVTPNLLFGANVGAVYNSNTLDAPYIFQSNADLKGLKTLLNLHTNGVGWNSGFGMLARPGRRLQLGASYRTATAIVSTGTAAGNMGAQFAALGIPFPPNFAYTAQVKVRLPQSAIVSASWQATPVVRFSLQSDWTGWKDAFNDLPVTLTQGTNADINSFLKSSSLKDEVPLDWKDQLTFRGSVQRTFGENLSFSGGFLHGNDPVPNSTLTPLTAAIMQNGVSAGVGYRIGPWRFDLGYTFDFTAQENVGSSALLSGEYSNSQVKIGMQTITLSTTIRL